MKRFWYAWTAAALSVAMISPTVAQDGGEIGSYQSILSRAGFQQAPNYIAPGEHPGITPPQHPTAPAQHRITPPQQAGVPFQQSVPQTPLAPRTVVQDGFGGTDPGHQPVANGLSEQNYVTGATGCGGDVYSPGACFRGGRHFLSRLASGGGSNTVVGVFGLFFDRDYEDDRPLSSSGAGGYLFSTDADNDTIGGVGIDLIRRNCNGRGFGIRYWGLYSNTAQASLSPAPLYTAISGLSDLTLAGYNVAQIYNYGRIHTVTRESEIQNLEVSVFRNGGAFTTCRGRSANVEFFGGFRWFEFDEDFRYTTCRDYSGGVPAGVPDEVYFNLETSNTLLGAQVGGRSEVCLTNRLRFAGSTRVGLFNNHIQSDQNIREFGGPFAVVNATSGDYNYSNEKNDVAFIGEFDVALIYQFSQKTRFNIGYRALGVSGVALAADQIPYNFNNVAEITRIKSNGELILHGGYAGLEFCF